MKQTNNSSNFELGTWDDVDRCLRDIGECEIAINEVEAMMNITINGAKERAAKLAKPMQTRIKTLTVLVKAFVEDSKSDMGSKSKQLNFGRVGFRQSSSVTVPSKKMEAVLRNLKKFGMEDCISTKEILNKEALEKYSDSDIAKIGASRKVEDKFWLETDKERIKG